MCQVEHYTFVLACRDRLLWQYRLWVSNSSEGSGPIH
jgi:hypothetical protein